MHCTIVDAKTRQTHVRKKNATCGSFSVDLPAAETRKRGRYALHMQSLEEFEAETRRRRE